jgi:hypothetical protein
MVEYLPTMHNTLDLIFSGEKKLIIFVTLKEDSKKFQ